MATDQNLLPPDHQAAMKGIGVRFESSGDDKEDEELLDAVVAISPEEEVYFKYEDIPPIPSPSFLLVRGGVIVADRWIIAVKPWHEFLDFAGGLCVEWNDHTDDGRRQLGAFVEAVEHEVKRVMATNSQ